MASYYPALFTVDPDVERDGWDWGAREHFTVKAEWPQACHEGLRTFCVCMDIPFFLPLPDYARLSNHYPYGWNWTAHPSEDADVHPDTGLTERETEFFRSLGP